MPSEAAHVRVAIYARISQDREGAGVKVEAQVAECEAYCDVRGWAEPAVWTDNDTSAYRGRVRTGFKRLCAAIAARQIDVVVVTHLDRLFRSNLELEGFIALIERTACRVYSVRGADYDLSTSDGQFIARIVGAAARKESADKSRRIRAKQVHMAEEGRHHGGGRRPFGYGGAPVLDGHGNPVLRSDGTPMLDQRVLREDEAALIREAARRVLRGESTWSILRDWAARGVQSSTGAPWNNRSLNQLLTSARVAGKRSHHGVITCESAEWPAILDEETWLGVRAVLAGRSEPAGRRPTYLLSGLVLCPCGSKMRSQAIRGRRRYTCVSGPSGGCGKCSRDAERLEAFVTRLVLLLASSGATPVSVHSGQAQTAPEVAALEARLARLAEEYTDEMWTREEYLHLRGRLEGKLATAQEQAAAAVAQSFRADAARGPSVDDWWQGTPDERRRAIVRDFVRGVVVHPVGRGYRGDTTFENTDVLLTKRGEAAKMLDEQAPLEEAS